MLSNCEGKDVRGSDGHRVGRVIRSDAGDLVIESGLISVHHFAVPEDEVASITDHELYLRRPAHRYRPSAPKSAWTPWHSGRRDAEGRAELEGLARADREHRLGAQGEAELSSASRSSLPSEADRLEGEREDYLAGVEGTASRDPLTPKDPRGSPPEARIGDAHPEDDPWP